MSLVMTPYTLTDRYVLRKHNISIFRQYFPLTRSYSREAINLVGCLTSPVGIGYQHFVTGYHSYFKGTSNPTRQLDDGTDGLCLNVSNKLPTHDA